MKILQEINTSKKQVANILGNETANKLNQQLVLQQRQAASSQLKQDLTTLQQASALLHRMLYTRTFLQQ